MIGERHNAPQHNLHANQAGNAGDCKSSAHSSLSWRRLGRFFATTVLASFVLNEIWEMAQMSAYVETAEPSWTSTLALCTRAAGGDVGIILGSYAAGALAAGDLGWGTRGRWNIYATVAVLGLAYAALVIHGAHARGVRAWRGPVAATPNDAAASAHVLVCPVVGRSQRNERGVPESSNLLTITSIRFVCLTAISSF